MSSTNDQSGAPPTGAFKEQLDQRAMEERAAHQSQHTNPVVEKIVEYVPAASKILGVSDKEEETSKTEVPGPPERPYHDGKIEEFVRDQHRSKLEAEDESKTQGAI